MSFKSVILMGLYRVSGKKLEKLTATAMGKEKDIQKLCEDNLDILLNIDFLRSEYSTSFGGRIDTLGLDKNGAPVIIEYKKGQNDNVINQGLSYLKWLLDHKADYERLCKEKGIETDIDWESPRVICIAESYNKFDLDTADLLPIKIELYVYKIYDGSLLYLEAENQREVKVSTNRIFETSKREKQPERLLKNYEVDDHLKTAPEKTKSVFLSLKEKIMNLNSQIREEPKAMYIAYKLNTNFVDIVVNRDFLKIFLNLPSGKLSDPKHLARDLTKPQPIGHWGNGDYEVKVYESTNLDDIMDLIKQSYNYNK